MTLDQYIDSINQRYKLGNATEHTFRGDLQLLLESIVPEIRATNEPKRQSCGAPDYILTKRDIPVGFIEAKDIGDKDLDGLKKAGNKEQFDRYKSSLNNLIFTDYINFHLYVDGEFVTKISIGSVENEKIVGIPENYQSFQNLITDFCSHISQTIKSSKRLAEMMAGKARLLSDVIERSLNSDENNLENSTLKEQMAAFKSYLIHDITAKGFADVYAQTIAYGLFAARLHDPTLETFSRQEAAELIPKSNPFLRKLFGYIAGPDIDDRIKWIVDSLVEIFLACNVEEILKNYGRSTKMEDPIIHFYEDFLAEYDPKLRKSRGVWYTPAPVVNFIVRAVDKILISDFNLNEGLADTSKIRIKKDTQVRDKRSSTGYKQVEEEIHQVQILDPATGTGTFLAEVIKQVHEKFKNQQGIWSGYVEDHLIPRLNGFELLMASYAMAHLQIDLLLGETGFKPTTKQRTRIYLTNSLEEAHPDTGTLLAGWLSSEANEANYIKRDTPVMCVIGNPPYSISSYNQSSYIDRMMELYRKDVKDERNIQLLSDDYSKFIRYAHQRIEQSGSGVVGFITKNSYINVAAFKGMRLQILKFFDKVYVMDLHGKMYEKTKNGEPNENVFDIRVGTAILFLVKNGSKPTNSLAKVYYKSLDGSREFKYDYLTKHDLDNIDWRELELIKPYYFFEEKGFNDIENYNEGVGLDTIFDQNISGITTGRDHFIIADEEQDLIARLNQFVHHEGSLQEVRDQFNLKDQPNFSLEGVRSTFKTVDRNKVQNYAHKPFYNRKIYYDKRFIQRHRESIMKNFIDDRLNFAIVVKKRSVDSTYHHCFCTNAMVDKNYLSGQTYVFPLFLYPEETNQQSLSENENVRPNINKDFINGVAARISQKFNDNPTKQEDEFNSFNLFDYVYAILHSPRYREKYKELLQIDFPKIPYPKNKEQFYKLCDFGSQLRELHTMTSPLLSNTITNYPIDGSNIVDAKLNISNWKKINENEGRFWINEEQYFDNIPLSAWNFYVGGYLPAQKWLKDHKGLKLDYKDIIHYQRIITALSETDRLMKEIDQIELE